MSEFITRRKLITSGLRLLLALSVLRPPPNRRPLWLPVA